MYVVGAVQGHCVLHVLGYMCKVLKLAQGHCVLY